jgi:hypothetical protein
MCRENQIPKNSGDWKETNPQNIDRANVWSCNLTEQDFDSIYAKSRPSYTLTGYMELYLYAKTNYNPNDTSD